MSMTRSRRPHRPAGSRLYNSDASLTDHAQVATDGLPEPVSQADLEYVNGVRIVQRDVVKSPLWTPERPLYYNVYELTLENGAKVIQCDHCPHTESSPHKIWAHRRKAHPHAKTAKTSTEPPALPATEPAGETVTAAAAEPAPTVAQVVETAAAAEPALTGANGIFALRFDQVVDILTKHVAGGGEYTEERCRSAEEEAVSLREQLAKSEDARLKAEAKLAKIEPLLAAFKTLSD